RHALIRDALYRDLPRARRVAFHRAAAEALERRTPPPWTEVAHHAIVAGPGARLVERVVGAASALAVGHAEEDGVRLLERAFAVVDGAPRDGGGGARLLLALSAARIATGDVQGGRAAALRAADAARRLGDDSVLAEAALAHAAEPTLGQTESATHALLEEAL